jgi:two-component system nitrate/nitrite response regulator NarL
VTSSVLIADDHPILLSGLRMLIDADPAFEVVATATDGVEALERIRELEPAIAILDLNMPARSGLQVLAEATGLGLGTRVVILAASATNDDIHRIATGGAMGLIFKEAAPHLLLQCLSSVAAGQSWYSDDIRGIVSSQGEERRVWRERFDSLTDREIEVIQLVNLGRSNKEIAYALNLVEGTVKVHLNNVFRKLQVFTRAELTSRTKGHLRSLATHPQ